MKIVGVEVGPEGRCVHWRGSTDVVAIRLPCCAGWWACHDCHEAMADHPAARWPTEDFDERAVLCGVCRSTLAIRDYLATAGCPACGHPFNPRCALHHPRYFEVGAPRAPRLLAVDAGLRAGIAIYSADGRLERYRSTNFGTPKRLKAGVHAVLRDLDGLGRVVVEGGGDLAEPWLKEAARRNLPSRAVQAGVWRERLLLPRDRRTGAAAKEQADDLARRVIEWSGAPRPTSLRHDAAEAILVGLWEVLEAGWLRELPAGLRPH